MVPAAVHTAPRYCSEFPDEEAVRIPGGDNSVPCRTVLRKSTWIISHVVRFVAFFTLRYEMPVTPLSYERLKIKTNLCFHTLLPRR